MTRGAGPAFGRFPDQLTEFHLDWRHKFRDATAPVFEELYESVANGTETQITLDANSDIDYKAKLNKELEEMGFRIAAFPLTILSASMKATQEVLNNFKNKVRNEKNLMSFEEIQKIVGFKDYFSLEKKYVKSKDND